MNGFFRIKTKQERITEADLSGLERYEYVFLIRTDGVRLVKASELAGIDVRKDLVELRAFDENKELHAVCLDGKITGRIRTDGEGDDTDAFEGRYLIWGRHTENTPYDRLHDDRGIDITVPAEVHGTERAFLRIRSYADTGGGVFSFSDFRLVSVETAEVR